MIHMRFVKDGNITGYGRIVPYEWLYRVCFQISANGSDWRESSSSQYDCDTIDRGIEVSGTVVKDAEVWHHNDTFLVDGKNAVLEYREDIHEWVFRCTKIRDSYRFADAVGSGCEIVRIGNIHVGEER